MTSALFFSCRKVVGLFCIWEGYMLFSLGLIFIFCLSFAYIFRKLKLPNIIAYIIVGIILGPNLLSILDPKFLSISAELRQIALIVILLRVGFSLNIQDLRKVGRPAILLSFVPASVEFIAYTVLAPIFFPISRIEAALLGAVISAVSPAVVVPRMLELLDKRYGVQKSIPQMILAGASCDDIFVLLAFAITLTMAQGNKAEFIDIFDAPISIISALIVAFVVGLILAAFFRYCHQRQSIIDSVKLLIIMSIAFFLTQIEVLAKPYFAFSSLLAVIATAAIVKIKTYPSLSLAMASKMGKLWIVMEIILFVLVGAAVDIRYTFEAGISAIGLIFIALIFRSLAVYICLTGTGLGWSEKLFAIISYLPKATVQAAIGAVPLSLGLNSGRIILSVAVLSILITAPLGAILMDNTYAKLLNKDEN